jgi:Domain of unknown function (DUF4397)
MPAQAQSNQTQVRFLHAVAGAGPASLLVEKGRPRLPSAFAKPSGYQVFRPGQTRLRLILNGQSSPVASEVVRLGPGKHTVVAVGTDKGVDLLVYQDDGVEPGKATLRAIHVASEVGKADVRVDGKVVASGVGLGDDTGYLAVPPGRHSVAVTRPGGKGGALVEATVRAVAGSAASGFVVGSAGMPAQIVLTSDGSAGPVAAPATGLGGATSSGAWLLILGSSLIGGSLGGASYVMARRTRSRGALQVATPALSAGPPGLSSVAAGPALIEVKEQVSEVPAVIEAPAVVEAPAVIEAPVVASPRPLPTLPPMSPWPSTVVAAAGTDNGTAHESNGNGHHPAEEAVAQAPARWTPPAGERWTPPTGRFARSERDAAPAPAGPRFIRPDDEDAAVPAPPAFPRFIRPDPEPAADAVPAGEAVPTGDSDTSEPVVAPPTPYLFGAPAMNAPAPEAERPLSPWPKGPAATPYPPVPAAQPEPAAPETDEPWSGSWIAAPAADAETVSAPEPPATFSPEPAPAPEPEPAAEVVVEPTEVVEAPAPVELVEEIVVDAIEVVEPPAPAEEPEATTEEFEAATEPVPVDEAPAVRTWSSTTSTGPAGATGADRPHKVNFLVVSGAALVVTGLIAARRGGRH